MIELKSIFDSCWHLAAHESDLAREGDYVRYTAFDDEVVLYHDGAGVIAFDNVCPHRGARFFDSHSGNSLAKCSYHGWVITRGAVRTPAFREYSGCNKVLNKFSLDKCGDFFFFAVSPSVSLRDYLGPDLYDALAGISRYAAQGSDVLSYDYQCNALVAVENALEPNHVPFVHATSLGALQLKNCVNRYFGAHSMVTFDIGNERAHRYLKALTAKFRSAEHIGGYMSIHIYPFCFLSTTAGLSFSIQSFFPKKTDRCGFTSRLYFPNPLTDVDGHMRVFFDSVKRVNKRVFEEDHEICRRISYPNWRRLFSNQLSYGEEKVSAFRRSIMRDLEKSTGSHFP
jgi:phenylpropionate dioxygenase-like ring-hydroxylating dioxygenase large terminal subunit